MDPGCSSANSFDTGEAASIDLDQNGWVRSLPARSDPQTFTSVATFWDVPSNFPAGRYVVLYRGHGTIEYDLAARKLDADSGSGESAFTKRMNWHGKRSAEVCDIFKRVFSDSPARVVCVIHL